MSATVQTIRWLTDNFNKVPDGMPEDLLAILASVPGPPPIEFITTIVLNLEGRVDAALSAAELRGSPTANTSPLSPRFRTTSLMPLAGSSPLDLAPKSQASTVSGRKRSVSFSDEVTLVDYPRDEPADVCLALPPVALAPSVLEVSVPSPILSQRPNVRQLGSRLYYRYATVAVLVRAFGAHIEDLKYRYHDGIICRC